MLNNWPINEKWIEKYEEKAIIQFEVCPPHFSVETEKIYEKCESVVDRDMNAGHPQYVAELLLIEPERSLSF